MKSGKKIITTIAIITIGLFVGCKKNSTTTPASQPTNSTNPIVIPIQTTAQAPVSMAGAANLAVLAGSGITNTGATNITGDMGLSPGTSVGGFPPGILVGTLHVNDAIATQAKLDLTAAYNDA